MAWNPTLNVFDPRIIGANLFAWFAENQADALAWANDGDAVLPPAANFFLNARTPTKFPVCMLERIGYSTETSEDIALVGIAARFIVVLMHGDVNWLAENAPKYAMAFESMAKNIPKTRLENGSKIILGSGVCDSIETTFDFLRGGEPQFQQIFNIEINWLCEFSNYAD